jgi:hypothetical protein
VPTGFAGVKHLMGSIGLNFRELISQLAWPVRLLKAAWTLAKLQSASERRFENRPALQLQRRHSIGVASPRRRRFFSPAIHPVSRVPVVSVLKALNTYEAPAYFLSAPPGRGCVTDD